MIDRHVMPAMIGGGGAVANDLAYNFALNLVPAGMGGGIVDQFRSGYMRHLGKAGSALGLAWLAAMFLPRRTADQIGAGALTVVGYNVARDVIATVAPDMPMGMYLEPTLSAYPGAGWNPGGTLHRRGPTTTGRRARLGMYTSPGAGGAGGRIPPQLTQGYPYAAAMPVYADEAAENVET